MGEFSQFALVPEQGIVPEMSQLGADMQSRISQMAARIDIADHAAVLGFGAKAQKEMNAFTDVALRRMMDDDIQPLGDTLTRLAESIQKCSFAQEAKGFLKRLFGGGSSLADLRRAYEDAEETIGRSADEMTDRRVALMRDSALLERLYERNEELYRELCSLIVVGEEAVRQGKARGADTAQMERRVQDIRVTQVASTQLAAQIRLVQNSDKLACERLQSALDVTIPLWKSQMAEALGLARANESLTMQGDFAGRADRGMRLGADELRAQTKQYAENEAQGDRERAEETGRALLVELTEIEKSLETQRQARRSAQ